MNFITFVRSVCNEYKTRQWYFTRPFSPPQAVKGHARQTRGGREMDGGERWGEKKEGKRNGGRRKEAERGEGEEWREEEQKGGRGWRGVEEVSGEGGKGEGMSTLTHRPVPDLVGITANTRCTYFHTLAHPPITASSPQRSLISNEFAHSVTLTRSFEMLHLTSIPHA